MKGIRDPQLYLLLQVGGERAPIDKYFSEQMMRDPWEGLAPHPIDKLT